MEGVALSFKAVYDRVLRIAKKTKTNSKSLGLVHANADSHFLVGVRDVDEGLAEDPVYVYLDHNFQVVSIWRRRSSHRRQPPGCNLEVGWIPVKYCVQELGIEWVSVHGILIHDGCVKKSVVKYSGVAREYDNSEYALTMDQEDWETGEFAGIDDEPVDLVDVMRKRRRMMFRRQGGVGDEFDEIELLAVGADSIMISSGGEGAECFGREYFLDRLKGRAEGKAIDLIGVIESLDNRVYQDGIRLPVDGSSIAPIGACRSRCNLTGSARFDLLTPA